MSEWFDVAPVSDFPAGHSHLIDVDDVMISVFNINGEFFALEDKCTHNDSPLLGCGLDPDEIINGDTITCPRHGARFCIRTGTALNPPAFEAILCFPTRIENDIVQVRDDRWD